MNKSKSLRLTLCLFAASLNHGYCQNTLQFTSVNATPENAMQLHWQGNSNEIYEIDYATSLIDTNTGTTTWLKLYDDYPSQGTNTFWLDTGNYYNTPVINHPKFDATRFYRVITTGTDTTTTEPTITVLSPANGDTVSSNIPVSVSAYSPDTLASIKLYVDGQEMPPSSDGSGTNFVINTCEWWNGQHVIYATAESVSHFEGIPGDTSVTYGHAVSQMVNLTFNNLITEIAFSQPYFEPSQEETQQVTAQFAANVNWTLQIEDVNGNTVRNASGSGGSMLFNWDGTGNGETNISDGTYTYFISAQTNGLALPSGSGGYGGTGSLPPLPMMAMSSDNSEQLYVEDAGNVVPLELYPPNFDTNGYTLIEATPSQIQAARQPHNMAANSFGGFRPDGTGSSGGSVSPSSQETQAPVRPPTSKNKGTVGTFLVGYNTYESQSGSFSTPPIRTGWPDNIPPQYVQLDGETSSHAKDSEPWGPLLENVQIANNFVKVMRDAGWKGSANPTIAASDVTSEIFNSYNVGFLCCHASYGTTPEDDGVTRSYLRFYNNNTQSASYCRLDDCSFGSPSTNGLKWMAILGCSVLQDTAYNSLYEYGRLPINNDLHILLATESVATMVPRLGTLWPQKMLGVGTNAQAVEPAWFAAGQQAYNNSDGQGETNHITITFRAAYWPDALSDTITNINASYGTGNTFDIAHDDRVVFSNP